MRILTRYILKEIASHFLLGALVFTFVVFIRHIGTPLEIIARHNVLREDVLPLFLLPLPTILVLTIPMAVLLGTLIGLSRMAADGEVVAVRASGIGASQFVRPVMGFALIGLALAACMSLSLGPLAVQQLDVIETSLQSSQIAYEIRPRIFLEQFPNLLLYLQDVSGIPSLWRGVFIADNTQRDELRITLAKSGILVNEPGSDRLVLHLEQGTTHEFDPQHPEQYSVVSFTESDLPVPWNRNKARGAERRTPSSLPLPELARLLSDPQSRRAGLVELHYRFAVPVASLVLALVGMPLGLSTNKGGKAIGVVLTIALVFAYYIIMAFGLSLARQGRIGPGIGVWLANIVFGATGILLLTRIRGLRRTIESFQSWLEDLYRRFERRHHKVRSASLAPAAQPRKRGYPLFQILDAYVLRSWIFYFLVLVVAFTGIYIIFDFFQLLGDIIRNHARPLLVLNYYRFLLPEVIDLMLPFGILVATLVNLGLLVKTNELTAIKSSGTSMYRVGAPILLMAALLSVGMFMMEDNYLPETNQQQHALRNQIKGKPAQTYYRPDREWIFGQSNRIYNYRFFDYYRDVFANLSVFEFDPQSFRMTRRVYAARAFWEPHIRGWILENGWSRELKGDKVVNYMPFSVASFRQLNEEPAYFKKEVKPSEQMSAAELARYIHELRQSGFDVVRLVVQFHRKFSFPLIAFVVTLIGIPFALTTGRKGALSGFAVSIAIAIVFWSLSSLFEAMGNLSQLPPAIAAWSPDALFGLTGAYLLLHART